MFDTSPTLDAILASLRQPMWAVYTPTCKGCGTLMPGGICSTTGCPEYEKWIGYMRERIDWTRIEKAMKPATAPTYTNEGITDGSVLDVRLSRVLWALGGVALATAVALVAMRRRHNN